MTVLEQRFFECVPMLLKDIADELKRANNLKEKELDLKNKEVNE